MNSLKNSLLLKNIARFNLDARISKIFFSVKGTNNRMGERISVKAGHSPATIDYRPYVAGDALKDIDWKLTARAGKTFVKIREGYRQTDFMIIIDASESMKTSYNDSEPSKFITALTLAYLVGRVAIKSRDRLYLLWQDEKIKIDSENNLLEVLGQLEKEKIVFNFWEKKFEPLANVFVISDFFIEEDIFYNFLKNLSQASKNLFFFAVKDLVEKNFSFKGRYHFLDPESPNFTLTETEAIEKKYQALYKNHYFYISKKSKEFGVKVGSVINQTDPFLPFLQVMS